MSEENEFTTTRYKWVPVEEDAWLPMKLIKQNVNGGTALFETIDEPINQLKIEANMLELVVDAHLTSIRENYNNLVALDEFSEGAIIHQIRQRYKRDEIYTYIGNILIAVNPFKHLGIYGHSVLQKYFGKNNSTSALDPHVFAVANTTYQSLLQEKIDQSIIISGESGSGKTETTKLVLQFLSDVAGSKNGVEQQIMLSNPILEAFGNAKTSRNNNSSRFGKWMEIMFNSTGHIIGCKIVNYLLEKSRVVQQAKGERNYHFFYQLCAGSSASDKVQFKIWNAERYNYLSRTGTFSIEGVHDGNDYAEVISALEKLKFSSDDIQNIVAVVASILHLGNISLVPNQDDPDASSISNHDQLRIVSNIMQVSPESLENAICYRTLLVRNESQIIRLNPEQAADTRDSLSKAIYGNLFDWIIKRINQFLFSSVEDSRFSIGVLDIFGFEVFEKNSFEQFCINFANEKLQALFNDYVFRMECAEYEQEGVTFPGTGFIDNTQTLLLISGIIDKIDEECVLPKGTDKALIEKMSKLREPSLVLNRINHSEFSIMHYAGSVAYNVEGFVEKSRGAVHEALLNVVMHSSQPLIALLFAPEEESGDKTPGKKPRIKTLGSKFRMQLDALNATLKKRSPQFIRCLKPNQDKLPNLFRSNLVLSQMQYSGLCEAIRVRASGYAYRQKHDLFYGRYRALLPRHIRTRTDASQDSKKKCQALINEISDLRRFMNKRAMQLGLSKIFYKSEVISFLEERRELKMRQFALILQSMTRSLIAKKVARKLKSQVTIAFEALKYSESTILSETISKLEDQDFDHHLLKQLKELLKFLEEEQVVYLSMQSAYDERDLVKVEGAITHANKLNIKGKSRRPSVIGKLLECEKLKVQLYEQRECRQKLASAITLEEAEGLVEAINFAKSAGLDNEPSFLEAKMLLDAIVREEELFQNLEKALSLNDRSKIDQDLKSVESIQRLSPQRAEIRGRAISAMLNFFRTDLQGAIKSKSASSIKEHINIIKNSRFCNQLKPDIKSAEELLMDINHLKNDRKDEKLLKKTESGDKKRVLNRKSSKEEETNPEKDSKAATVGTIKSFFGKSTNKGEKVHEIADFKNIQDSVIPSAPAPIVSVAPPSAVPPPPPCPPPAILKKPKTPIAPPVPSLAASSSKDNEQKSDQSSKTEVSHAQNELEKQMKSQQELLFSAQHNPIVNNDNNEEKVSSSSSEELKRNVDEIYIDEQIKKQDAERKQREEDEKLNHLKLTQKMNDDEKTKELVELAYKERDKSKLDSLIEQMQREEPIFQKLIVYAKSCAGKLVFQEQKMTELEKSMEDLDIESMKNLLQELSDSSMPDNDLIVNARIICFATSPSEIFRFRFEKAIEKENYDQLKSMLKEASSHGISARDIRAVRLLLSPSNNLESNPGYFELKGMGEDQKTFESLKGLFSIETFSELRSSEDFAKRAFLSRPQAPGSMLKWQVHPIPRSLIDLNEDYCKGKQKVRSMKNLAKDIFKNILGYTKDRYHPFPLSLASEILTHGFKEPLIRNEIYCQILKQLRLNPSSKSLLMGWKLLYMCLQCFFPSKELLKILWSFVAEEANHKITFYIPFDTIPNVAANCFKTLKDISRNLVSERVLPMDEIRRITDDDYPKLHISTPDESKETIKVQVTSATMTCGEVCKVIMNDLKIDNVLCSLAVQVHTTLISPLQFFFIQDTDSILEVFNHWEWQLKSKNIAKYRLCLHVKGAMVQTPPSKVDILLRRKSSGSADRDSKGNTLIRSRTDSRKRNSLADIRPLIGFPEKSLTENVSRSPTTPLDFDDSKAFTYDKTTM